MPSSAENPSEAQESIRKAFAQVATTQAWGAKGTVGGLPASAVAIAAGMAGKGNKSASDARAEANRQLRHRAAMAYAGAGPARRGRPPRAGEHYE